MTYPNKINVCYSKWWIVGSAGIGRTGMLILMDTALSLLQMNEPIYPLDILKNMRDQRPCMVQNVVSFIRWTFPITLSPFQSTFIILFCCFLLPVSIQIHMWMYFCYVRWANEYRWRWSQVQLNLTIYKPSIYRSFILYLICVYTTLQWFW